MIAVDTSVWVRWFRGGDARVRAELDRILDEDLALLPVPARVELLAGAGAKQVDRLATLLHAVRSGAPGDQTWARVEAWACEGARKGTRFGMGDLLIAAVAADAGAPLWSLDRDFEDMARLGWIELHRLT